MELTKRPRRLRGSENLRKMVRETRMDKSSLMYPMFVMEGENKEEEIPMAIAVFSAVMMWTMTRRWSFLQKQHFPTWKQVQIWLLRLI